jgi:hypothetical protein
LYDFHKEFQDSYQLIYASDPYYYIPKSAFAKGVLKDTAHEEKAGKEGSAAIAKLVVGSKSTDRIIVFPPSQGLLSNLARVEFGSIGLLPMVFLVLPQLWAIVFNPSIDSFLQ